MKKILFSLVASLLLLSGYAQHPNREIQVNPRLYDVLGANTIEDLRANNPRQLIIENCNITHYCFLLMKQPFQEGTYQMMGDLKSAAKAGTTCNYQEIIQAGYITPSEYNLKQHSTLYNIYTLGNTGGYIVVSPVQYVKVQTEATLKEYGF